MVHSHRATENKINGLRDFSFKKNQKTNLRNKIVFIKQKNVWADALFIVREEDSLKENTQGCL